MKIELADEHAKIKPQFILEIETGLIDCWYYTDENSLMGVLKFWDEVRPEYHHIIAELRHSCMYRVPDNRRLNRKFLSTLK